MRYIIKYVIRGKNGRLRLAKKEDLDLEKTQRIEGRI